jgi:TolB-like protein
MSHPAASIGRLRFGAFEADLHSSELFCGGVKVRLQEKPFQILVLLLARPGEVLTREQLRERLWPDHTFVDYEAGLNTAMRKLRLALGDDAEQPVFIETLPRQGYRFMGRVEAVRDQTNPLASLAVLPFHNESSDSELEFICDAVTESLINTLSELPNVGKVIARNSVFRYKDRQIEAAHAGRALEVVAVLAGRVLERDNELVVSAELIATHDNRHLWGGSYHRKIAAISSLAEEVADEIASTLRQKFAGRSERTQSHRRTASTEAYQLYVRGRHCWNKRPAVGIVQKGIALFEEAIAQDPQFALPYVGLADSYNTLAAWESGSLAPNIALPKARAAASKALELDDSLAEAHTSLAYGSLHYEWQWEEAEARFRKALRLNPQYVHARHWYSHYLVAMGRMQESLAESERIIQLDPLDSIINVHLAWHYYMAREFDLALAQARRTLEPEPGFHWGHFFAGLALQPSNLFAAVDELRKAVELSGGSSVMQSALGHAYALAGDTAAATLVLRNLRELAQTRYISSYEVGLIHAALGEIDESFVYLNKALEERSGWLAYLNADPRLDRIRLDRRFEQLRTKVGLPENRKSAHAGA